ncbi:hypothetical protein llap_18722 [Limosa lapponica baueri]|uniref:Uncharacterized protein n=1 Tax=Limosa lapponica baueri TaxID=1758121 RepID=A0A2I0TB17_LIMLA|nr:hypothetical protein llap_18722 [Limosa lapponica baueri]
MLMGGRPAVETLSLQISKKGQVKIGSLCRVLDAAKGPDTNATSQRFPSGIKRQPEDNGYGLYPTDQEKGDKTTEECPELKSQGRVLQAP